MRTLRGNHIYLRALELEDLEDLYYIENDETLWHVAETVTPFSRHVLSNYLANAHKDIFETRQLRLVICKEDSKVLVGMIDLFDFDPINLRVGIGIIIKAENERKGYAIESLSLVLNYCKTHLKLHQLYANIGEDNAPSIALFKKMKFTEIGLKKDWRRKPSSNGQENYVNEYLYQYIF